MTDQSRLWTFVGIFVGVIIFIIYDTGQEVSYYLLTNATPDQPKLWAKTIAFSVSVIIGMFAFHKMSKEAHEPIRTARDPLSSHDSYRDKQPRERLKIRLARTDPYIIGFLVFCASLIVIIHLQSFEIAQEKHPQMHIETISNPLFKKENMTLYIGMAAHTFSAHEEIDVSVELFQNSNERSALYNDAVLKSINWSKAIYRIGFEDTYCVDIRHGIYVGCYFDLSWNASTLRYANYSQIIKYSVGGSHDILLYNQTTTDVQFRQGIMTSKVGTPFIQTESIAAINSVRIAEDSFNAQKHIYTITIIALVIGVLTFYQRIRRTLLARFGEYRRI